MAENIVQKCLRTADIDLG